MQFIRYISTNGHSANEQSLTVSCLINSCGLSRESALTASKHVHLKTLTKPDSVLALLKDRGLSKTEISKVVERHAKVLVCDPCKTLLPKLDFFLSKGFSASYLANILTPSIFNPKMETLATKTNLLLDKEVSESNIVTLLRIYPRVFTVSFDKLKGVLDEAIDMGFDPSIGLSSNAVRCLNTISKSTWKKKVDLYKRWNLSESEILAAFRKQPEFMMTSKDKIMAVMDLFVNKLGWESSSIAKHPGLMACSLKKRLIPRASVLQLLVSRGLVEKNCRYTTIFRYPEMAFLKKFVD